MGVLVKRSILLIIKIINLNIAWTMIHKYIGPTSRDETAPYSCEYSAHTLRDLVDEIIHDHPDEWGYIKIKDLHPKCEYSKGYLVTMFPEELLDKKINSVMAHGGWTRMDYYVELNNYLYGKDK